MNWFDTVGHSLSQARTKGSRCGMQPLSQRLTTPFMNNNVVSIFNFDNTRLITLSSVDSSCYKSSSNSKAEVSWCCAAKFCISSWLAPTRLRSKQLSLRNLWYRCEYTSISKLPSCRLLKLHASSSHAVSNVRFPVLPS
jgi:hypothetical protein